MKTMNATMTGTMTTTPVSRRQLLKGGLGAALGIGLAAGLSLPGLGEAKVSAAIPTLSSPMIVVGPAPKLVPIDPTPAPVIVVGPSPKLIPVAVPFTAYHGVTGAEHQSRFNALGTTGYRMISLSISGLHSDPRYAAVWVQRAGAAQRAVHGVTAAQYQQWFDAGVAEGFVPTIVSATGTVDNPRFAAVAENNVSGPWVARHNIDFGQYVNQNLAAREETGLYLHSVAIYGSSLDRRYAGVWRQNTQGFEWSASMYLETPQEYQRDFDFFTQEGWQPRYVGVSSSQAFAPVYHRGDTVEAVTAHHGLTADAYQQVFDQHTVNGLIPAVVQGGGIGNATRYAAIFVTQAAIGLYC